MRVATFSVYSLVSAVLFFSIGLLIIRLLRRNTVFLVKNSTTDLLVLLILSICRILLPLDLSYALVLSSKSVIPFIQEILSYSVWNHITIGMLLVSVWIIGVVGSILKDIWNVANDFKKVKSYSSVKSEQVERVLESSFPGEKIKVVVSPEADVPMTLGLKNAFIYLPLLSVSDKDLELILRHELQHIKGRDLFVKFFYIFLKAVFWWNPIIHIFQQEVDHMLELKCDMSVTKNMKKEERIQYLETILNVMKQVSLEKESVPCSVSQLVSGNADGIMKQRFEVILNEPAKKKIRIHSALMILIGFLCSYLIIFQPDYLPPAEDIAGSVTITEEDAYIVIDDDGAIRVFVDDKPFTIITDENLNSDPFNKLPIKIRKESSPSKLE